MNEPNAAVGKKGPTIWDVLGQTGKQEVALRGAAIARPGVLVGSWTRHSSATVWREKLHLLASVSRCEKGMAESPPGSQQLWLCIYKRGFPPALQRQSNLFISRGF